MMGIQATVVYDVVKHEPVVVRGSSSNATSTATLADTIASFSEHVTLNQGKAKTPVEVCALWGGPPYITYVLVRKRFRVIVIWDEEPGELDTGYDVHYCVSTLQRAVGKQAPALAEGDTAALASVYEAAGHALLGGDDEYADSKTVASDVALDEAIAASTPKKKGGLRKFLSKTLKVVEGENNQAPKLPKIRAKSKKDVLAPNPPDLSNAMSESQLETTESKLLLPPEMFNWADFGGDLPASGGDIAWIAELLRGDERRVTIAAPVLRDDDGNDDVLKISSAASANGEAVASVSSPPIATMSPPPSLPPAVSPPRIAPVQVAQSAISPQPSQTHIPVSNPAKPPVPVQSPQEANPIITTPPVVIAPISNTQPSQTTTSPASTTAAIPMPTPINTVKSSPNMLAVPVVNQTPSVVTEPSQEQLSSSPPPHQEPPIAAVPVAGIARAPSSGFRGRGDAGDDFDVNALGGYKDSSTSSIIGNNNIASSNTSGTSTATDQVRGMMNSFAKSMQNGDFATALKQVYGTLRLLSTLQPHRVKETNTCANYVLALKIMARVRTLPAVGAGAIQAAILTMFMAESKHLLPTHRAAAMRMAVDKNMAVGNFGMAARWLRQLGNDPRNIQKLQLCMQRGEANAHMPPTNKLCYNLLVVLAAPYGKCTRCTAVYRPGTSGVQIGQKCPTCFVGNIVVAQQ